MKRHTRSKSFGEIPPKGLEDNLKLDEGSSAKIKERPDRNNLIKQYLIDYTANSNLHGLKYIGEKERTFVEKVFWTFMFTCCVVLCAGLISKVYHKWNESPVIVSFAENPMPVWKIPYPAVTLCFQTKAMQTKYNFTEYYHLYNDEYANLTEHERFQFEDVSLVCDSYFSPPNGRKFGSGIETVNTLKEVSPNITEVFLGCKLQEVYKDHCSDLFLPILTEEGICYTFNTMGAEQLLRLDNLHSDYEYLDRISENLTISWTLEDGYPDDTPIETYPHRALGYGAKAGLSFLLRTSEEDLDFLCKGPVQGFKILLHNPTELPRLFQQYFRVPLSQEVVVSVKPKMMTTSEGLLPYNPNVQVVVLIMLVNFIASFGLVISGLVVLYYTLFLYNYRRKCYFSSERYLQYFKVYTQANCEMECLSNLTYARCGCVHFWMMYGPNLTVCNAGSVECVQKAQMEMIMVTTLSSIEKDLNEENSLGEAREIALRCMCLPACTSIEYEAETSQADYDWRAILKSYKVPDIPDEKMTRISIFFKEAQFTTSRRSEMYGTIDFLANCGGLLGLFMGFSILSLVEILYFLTLRLCCVFWNKRNHKRVSDKTKSKLEYLRKGRHEYPQRELSFCS